MQLAWSVDWVQRDTMAKKLLPIVLSCAVQGPLLSGSNVEFKYNNRGVADSINKGSSNELLVMHLLQCLWFFSTYFNSRNSADRFLDSWSADMLDTPEIWQAEMLILNPHASTVPEIIPVSLLKLLSPDWTSPSFLHHFKHNINKLQAPQTLRTLKHACHAYVVVDYVTLFISIYCFSLCFCCLWFVICLYGL